MNRTSADRTIDLLLNAAIIGMAVWTNACTAGDGRRDSGAARGDTSASTAKHAVTAEVPQLPDKIERLIHTPELFVAVVSGRSWKGRTVARQCEESGCGTTAEGPHATVRHEAIEGANDLDLTKLPENGVVVSRMTIFGTRTERMFGLKANSGEWYLILTPSNKDSVATARLVNLDYDNDGEPKLKLHGGPFEMRRCDDGDSHHGEADAGFKKCDKPTPTNVKGAAAESLLALPTSFNRGAWITCSLGCCTSESGRSVADSVRADSMRKADSVRKADSTRKADSAKQQPRSP